jgi:hypothetical protein
MLWFNIQKTEKKLTAVQIEKLQMMFNVLDTEKSGKLVSIIKYFNKRIRFACTAYNHSIINLQYVWSYCVEQLHYPLTLFLYKDIEQIRRLGLAMLGEKPKVEDVK